MDTVYEVPHFTKEMSELDSKNSQIDADKTNETKVMFKLSFSKSLPLHTFINNWWCSKNCLPISILQLLFFYIVNWLRFFFYIEQKNTKLLTYLLLIVIGVLLLTFVTVISWKVASVDKVLQMNMHGQTNWSKKLLQWTAPVLIQVRLRMWATKCQVLKD